MKNLNVSTWLVAILAMAAYVKADNFLPASAFLLSFTSVLWIFLVPQDCIPLIAKTGASNDTNGFQTVGEVCIRTEEVDGVFGTVFDYSVIEGFSIVRAYSGVHRNCQQKVIFPYQRSERLPPSTTSITQFVGFDEYVCPVDFPDGCCNRRNCFSPKLRVVRDGVAGFVPLNAFPPNDPSGPFGCRTINGLRRCLTELRCLNPVG
mmetsp:Transcript_1496/g.2325  ORF Transcript_1496/g.2325 Transcript_1496/m.2325 type:complete len:205 (-) Transcript_1496:79-693(-)